jgi:Ca-activated chloride channel family protein
MSAVVRQALNKTTLQVNLLNKEGQPTETDVPFTLYDHATKSSRYNWVHKLDARGNPDTLIVDARGIYDIVVHCIPSVTVENIQLTPGKHNAVAIDLPRGVLQLQLETKTTQQQPISVQCLVRQSGSKEILYVQDFNTAHQYLEGTYDLEILTLPRIEKQNVNILAGQTSPIKIPQPGTLQLNPTEIGVASVLMKVDEQLVKVYDFYSISTAQTLPLQPGTYTLVWRPDKGRSTAKTKVINFEIASLKTTTLKP